MAGEVNVGELVAKLRLDMAEWKRGFDEAARGQQQFGRDFERQSQKVSLAFGGLVKGALAFSAAMVGFRGVTGTLAAAKNAVIGMNSTLETAQLQFKALLKSGDAAKEHVRSLFDFAAKTPFETGPILQASRLLLTFGVSAQKARESLTLVGDAAAVSGRGIQDVAFWFGRAYSMIQGGRPFGEAAMRLQEMGILSAEGRTKIEKLQEAGASAKETFAALESEFRRFGGSMVEMAGTWTGLTSTISDNVQLALAEGFRPLFDALKALAKEVADFVQTEGFTQWVRNTAELMAGAVTGTRDLAAGVADLYRELDAQARRHEDGPFSKWLTRFLNFVGRNISAVPFRFAETAAEERQRADLEAALAREPTMGPPVVLPAAMPAAKEEPLPVWGGREFTGVLSTAEVLRDRAAALEAFARAGDEAAESLSEVEAAADDLSQALSDWPAFFAGLSDGMEEVDSDLRRISADQIVLTEKSAGAEEAIKAAQVELRAGMAETAQAADEMRSAWTLFGRSLDELGPKEREQVQRLAAIREEARRFGEIRGFYLDVFGAVGGAFEKLATGIIQGTQTVKAAFANLGQYIIVEFAQRVIRQALAPLINSLATLAAGLTMQFLGGGGGAGGGFLGGAAQAAGSALVSGGVGAGANAAGGFGGVGTFQAGLGFANAFPGIYNLPSNYALGGLSGAAFGLPASVSFGTGALELGAGVGAIGGAATAPTSGLLGSAGMISSFAPYLAAAGIALNLGSAIFGGDPTGPAAIGTYAGTGIGAGIGAGIGFAIGNVPGAIIGALLGGALGGSGGGFLGGMFGGKKKTRAQRNAESRAQQVQLFNEFGGALGGVQSLRDLYDAIAAFQPGAMGGGRNPVASTFFSPEDFGAVGQAIGPPVAPPGFQFPFAFTPATAPRPTDLYPGASGVYIGKGPNSLEATLTYEQFASAVRQDPDLIKKVRTLLWAGPTQDTGMNQGISDQIAALVEALVELDAQQITAARSALEQLRNAVREFRKEVGEAAGITTESAADFAAFRTQLDALVSDFADEIAGARQAIAEAPDLATAIALTDDLRTTIAQRYQEELAYIQQVVGAWVGAQTLVDAAVQGLRASELASTNPSEIYGARRADFQELLDTFFAAPDPGMAQAIVAGAQGVLEAGQLLWDRPSAAFQALFEDVAMTLESVSAALGARVAEFTGGAPFEDFMREKQQAVVDELALLHADLQLVIDRLDPSMGPEAALELLGRLSEEANARASQSLTIDQVAVGYLAQIAANTAGLGGNGSARGPWATLAQVPAGVSTYPDPTTGLFYPTAPVAGSYAGGTDYVPRTAPYLLHMGEAVSRGGGGAVSVQFGDIVVQGGGRDPEAQARAFADALERMIRTSPRMRAAVQAAARGM